MIQPRSRRARPAARRPAGPAPRSRAGRRTRGGRRTPPRTCGREPHVSPRGDRLAERADRGQDEPIASRSSPLPRAAGRGHDRHDDASASTMPSHGWPDGRPRQEPEDLDAPRTDRDRDEGTIHGTPRKRTTSSGGTRISALRALAEHPLDRHPTQRPKRRVRLANSAGRRRRRPARSPARATSDMYQLGVGRLPDEEVREAVLAAGPDHEVGVGQAGRIEGLGDRRPRRSIPAPDRTGEPPEPRRRARSGRRS